VDEYFGGRSHKKLLRLKYVSRDFTDLAFDSSDTSSVVPNYGIAVHRRLHFGPQKKDIAVPVCINRRSGDDEGRHGVGGCGEPSEGFGGRRRHRTGVAGLWGKKAGEWMKAQIIFNHRSVE
jgi:hypothetical protein